MREPVAIRPAEWTFGTFAFWLSAILAGVLGGVIASAVLL